MVRTGKTLTVPDVEEINRRMITHFGGIFFDGDDNLANRGSLEYVLDEIHGSLYGHELYPDIFQKAGLIAWRIIIGHIFHDVQQANCDGVMSYVFGIEWIYSQNGYGCC